MIREFNEVQKQLRSNRMIQQFLNNISNSTATAPSYRDLFPSQSEYADVELEKATIENELNTIKKSRTEKPTHVKRCAREYGSQYCRMQNESQKLQALLRKNRIADQLNLGRQARGNDELIESLATNPSLTTAAGRALNDMLASAQYELRSTYKLAGPRSAQLRAQLEHAQKRRSDLAAEREALVLQESNLENSDSTTVELKRVAECNYGREMVAYGATGCTLELSNSDQLICAKINGVDVRLARPSPENLSIRLLELLK